jgi:hypothetical protein
MSKAAFRIAALLAALLFSLMPARAQSPVSDTEAAARELITTMNLDDQFKALMPGIMRMIKPAIVQNRPDVEREFDALMPVLLAAMQAWWRFTSAISAPTNCVRQRLSIARQLGRNFCKRIRWWPSKRCCWARNLANR